jgi:hypothetical protein
MKRRNIQPEALAKRVVGMRTRVCAKLRLAG